MKILALDPGETIGYAILKQAETQDPELITSGQLAIQQPGHRPVATVNWLGLRYEMMSLLRPYKPDVLVLEDYRIYKGKAGMHVGQHLFTAELIGAICYICYTLIPQIPVVRMAAGKKGRWPSARLDAKFSVHRQIFSSRHAHDALVLALVYLEQEGSWDVS